MCLPDTFVSVGLLVSQNESERHHAINQISGNNLPAIFMKLLSCDDQRLSHMTTEYPSVQRWQIC